MKITKKVTITEEEYNALKIVNELLENLADEDFCWNDTTALIEEMLECDYCDELDADVEIEEE